VNKKILLINGPNLNMLGQRENYFYGNENLIEIETLVAEKCTKNSFEIGIFQSNIEGEICTFIQQNLSVCGIIINAGAYAHTSIAIFDSLNIAKNINPNMIIVEVHLSNTQKREQFRQQSYISKVADSVIIGMKKDGYLYAADFIINNI
jgi:3-dehydroquinate dehydratase-2